MPNDLSIFDRIGAAAGIEVRRTVVPNSSQSQASDQSSTNDGENPSNDTNNPGTSNDQDHSASKAQQEAEEFASNTSELHEFMQKNRMDSMQAQLDMVISEIRDKAAETTGKEIDNDLRKKMASFTVQFMSWWCLFVAAMFTSFMLAHEGKPPAEAIIALLGTSTISIVGLVGFVVSGLFKSRKEGEKDKG